MAQTGYSVLSIYYSSTAGNTPTAGNLVAGELAINTADGKLFYKDSSGVVQTLATKDATSGSFTSITDSGNLAFTGTGNRITGDFSNGTIANRVLFQTSTTNGNTSVIAIPNGTGTASTLQAFNNSDTANAARIYVGTSSTVAQLVSDITGTGTYLPLTMTTGGSERLRIDTSGNVGIGTSSPSQIFTLGNSVGGQGIGWGDTTSNYQNIWAAYSTADLILATGLQGSKSSDAYTSSYGGASMYRNAIRFDSFAGSGIRFFTDGSSTVARGTAFTPTERMRIDSSGNLLVGTTSFPTSSAKQALGFDGAAANGFGIYDSRTSAGSDQTIIFYRGTTVVGQINTTLTATSYVTSSDYRLKENIAPMQNALNVVQQLKPVTYNWKIDGSDGQGFIAHELQAVVPDCVTGEKDAVDAEGNSVYQGIDTSFLVATLTAAIQELKAELDATKAEIAALKK